RRLMQRRSVLLPAPEAPITETTFRPGTVRFRPRRTGSSEPYRLTRFVIVSMGVTTAAMTHAGRPPPGQAGRRPRARPSLRRKLLLRVLDAVRFLDLADDFPVPLVLDRDELAHPFELLAQGRSLEVEAEEGLLDLLDELGLQVMGI